MDKFTESQTWEINSVYVIRIISSWYITYSIWNISLHYQQELWNLIASLQRSKIILNNAQNMGQQLLFESFLPKM